MVQLQAHRGVCTEYPENTMSAFRGAICQDYSIIELDPNVTRDGEFVILHDDIINRTARHLDGSVVGETRRIVEMTYEEAAAYDYGVWFSPKFKGERLPLFRDVLQLAKKHKILLKVDNKIWNFPEKYMDAFWQLLRESGTKIAMTCNTLETVQKARNELPGVEIHYDGVVSEPVLKELVRLCENPVVWLPFESKETSWVKVPFASEDLCSLVKNYARLGLWIVTGYDDFDEIIRRFDPDIVETPGNIKPVKNTGCYVDQHTHSRHSHDSVCEISEMAEGQSRQGVYGFAVTDHCDMHHCKEEDVVTCIRESVAEVEQLQEKKKDITEETGKEKYSDVRIFSGIEIGESVWYPQEAMQALQMCDYDVIIGSVHTVKHKKYSMPYSVIDFSTLEPDECYDYLDCYFDEVLRMIQTMPCDVAAHLCCPLRYINGTYGRNIDGRMFEKKIREILSLMIQRGISLEFNTSGMCEDGRDWLDQDWLFGIYKEMGGMLVTLGSDAHVSSRASHRFEEALKILRKHGFRYILYYERHSGIQCTI